jgi:mannose-6-phosphate isomerase-like protein (cupin superfamily)
MRRAAHSGRAPTALKARGAACLIRAMREPTRSVPIVLLLLACGHTAPATAPASSTPAPAAAAPATPAAPAVQPAMFDALFPTGRITRPLRELATSIELAPGENFKIVELARDEHASHHVVALRDREPLHRHDQHDLFVVVLAGEGQMLLGDSERAIGAHSIVYVPRGAVHSMRNTAPAPLAGYAIFVPPFDGKDRVLVETAASAPAVQPSP